MLVDAANFLSENGRRQEADILYRMSLCFDPQNAEALFRFGLSGIADSTPATGAVLVERALRVDGAATLSTRVVIEVGNKRYQEAMRNGVAKDRARAERDLENFVVLAGTMTGAPIFFAAVTCLAEALGRPEMALAWCVKGLRTETDQGTAFSIIRAGLYLISVAKVDDDLIDALADKASAMIRAGQGNDLCCFAILYKKYWDGDDLGSQQAAREFRNALGDQGFLANNLLNSWHLCRYDDAFFSSIGAYGAIPDFIGPLTHEKRLPEGRGPVVLVSCDARYLEILGTKLLESAAIVGALGSVHLHVINATDDSRRIVAEIEERHGVHLGFSSENSAAVHGGSIIHTRPTFLKTYYACARFIRIAEFSELYNRPIVQIDTDCLLTSDITKLSICNHESDVGFLFDRMKTGPARQFNATFFLLNPHERSRKYARLLARYVAHYIAFDIPFWGLDQAALYCVYRYMERHGTAPTTTNVPSWELFAHVFPSSDDSMEGKIRKIDARLDALRAAA